MNFPTDVKWLTSGDYAISETVDFGEREIQGYRVQLSGYASRCKDTLRYFGHFKILRAGEILTDQRGIDVESFGHLFSLALEALGKRLEVKK